jgi:predicted  nucleic acid-binding Zn-ribbon protein
MNTIRSWRLPLIVILSAASIVAVAAFRNRTTTTATATTLSTESQDLTSLERRISLIEQRFYSVETSINRLEQQSRLSGSVQSPSVADRSMEVTLLRGEIETLQRRLSEIECGLTRLDERTLTPAAREARRRTGAGQTDPCRLNPDVSLKLSTRP